MEIVKNDGVITKVRIKSNVDESTLDVKPGTVCRVVSNEGDYLIVESGEWQFPLSHDEYQVEEV